MTVIDSHKDLEALTLTIRAEFDAPVDRVWQLVADPQKLGGWWGPPTYPATFHRFDLSIGSTVNYYMTSPEGDRYHGWWKVLEVQPPRVLVVEDGFADEHDQPRTEMPSGIMRIELADRDGGGTLFSVVSTSSSLEALQQVLDMGQEEGMIAAMGQMDAILAA